MNALEEWLSALCRSFPRGGGRVADRCSRFFRGPRRRRARVGDIGITLDFRHEIERLMYFRCYENQLIRFACSLLGPGDVVIDAGAHIGWLSLHFAQAAGRAGAIHGFEPVPEHFQRLAATFEAGRKVGYRLTANPQALGERRERATLSVGSEANPGFSTLLMGFSRDGLRKGFVEVDVLPLDEYLESRAIRSVGLLKIDTEGAEGRVLRGARRALESRRVNALIVEISPQADEVEGRSRGDSFRLLQSLGYEGHLLVHGRLRPLPDRYDFWVADTFWRPR